jgi:H+-transporting ATPase
MAWSPFQRANAGIIGVEQPGDYANPIPTTSATGPTGESVPIEASSGFQTFAGALVRRGEAEADVTATGGRTKFGQTAELVRTAHVASTQQKAVLRVVRNLAAFTGGVIILLVAYAWYLKMPVADIIPLVLTAILASIPVALPATFTLASALGARALANRGVLPTRLSAVDEAASMVVLCSDKTGTLTQNALTVTTVRPMSGFDDAHVLALAALASSDGGDDPVGRAIRAAAASKAVSNAPKLVKFAAFDPAKKMSEATATDATGSPLRIVKGAFTVVVSLDPLSRAAAAAAKELEDKGFRVLAVAAGPASAMKLAGLIALSDPPREDAAALVAKLNDLGVRTVMVTGDAPATAAIVAKAVGLDGAICSPGPIPDAVDPAQFQSSPASCRRASTGSLRRSRKAATPSGCAATAPMTRRRSARPRWESRSRLRLTSLNPPPAWC